jgi:hypothetical protein
MRLRWRFILPAAGLAAFAFLSLQATRGYRPANRFFWWAGIPLDSKPLMPAGSACKDGTDSCGAWGPASIEKPQSLLAVSLILAALPAFISSELMVGEFSRVGLGEVYTFMILTPLFIVAWFYVVGLVIDPRNPKRTG